jgi:hypothetical protein
MFSPNAVFFSLSCLIKNEYGDFSSPGDISPQEEKTARKLFKIFNSFVSNAIIEAFDLELEVEDHLILESEDEEFYARASKSFRERFSGSNAKSH